MLRNLGSSSVVNKKSAEKMLTEVVAQIHQGTYMEVKEITFTEFAEKWLSDYAESRVKPSTYRFYHDIIRLHLVPRFGESNLTSINYLHD